MCELDSRLQWNAKYTWGVAHPPAEDLPKYKEIVVIIEKLGAKYSLESNHGFLSGLENTFHELQLWNKKGNPYQDELTALW